MNYDRLVSTPAQLMYENMVKSFATLASITCDDNVKASSILKWIEVQCKEMAMSKSSSSSNVLSTHLASQCAASQDNDSSCGGIRD